MTYDTPQALRTALEARMRNESEATGLSPDRLRRRVIFQRIVTRLQRAEPGRWVVKGGMAMEVRLRDDARLTKDLDLGLREPDVDVGELRDRLIDALSRDDDGDSFVFAVGAPSRLREDDGGDATWRVRVAVDLAGRTFGAIKLDISPRDARARRDRRRATPQHSRLRRRSQPSRSRSSTSIDTRRRSSTACSRTSVNTRTPASATSPI